jgi:hypothetical protein
MKDLKNKLTTGKNTKNKSSRPKIKGFGYQVLGFGSGGGGPAFIEATGGTITELLEILKFILLQETVHLKLLLEDHLQVMIK